MGLKKKKLTLDHLLTLKCIINKYVYDNKKRCMPVLLILKEPLTAYGKKLCKLIKL